MTLEAKGVIASASLLVGGLAALDVPTWVTSFGLLLAGVVLKAIIDRFQNARTARLRIAEQLAADARGRDVKLAELDKAQGITAAYLEMLRRELTHYHTPELDALMLIPFWELTPEQEARLDVLMEERSRDHSDEIPAEEREIAKLYLPMIRRAKVEREVLKTKGRKLQTVAVTQTEPNGEA